MDGTRGSKDSVAPDRQRIASIIARSGKVSADRLLADDRLSDLGLSSLDILNFAFDLEEEFGIEFEDKDLRGLETLSQVTDRIRALQETTP
jgi:acyl carrier protein